MLFGVMSLREYGVIGGVFQDSLRTMTFVPTEKGEPMKTELVYCDLTDCIYHENSKEEYHSTMAEPAPPICRLKEIRLVGGQCCEYDEAERKE